MSVAALIKVESIFLSPGHNFYGHYGKAPGDHKTDEAEKAECVAGKGIVGDRFFDHKENYKGQITFFSREIYDAMCEELEIHDRPISVLRRNVIVSGVDLNSLIGKQFQIQGVSFSGVQECSPCEWMDQAFGPGAMDFLKGNGGLRCRILNNGVLHADG